MSESHVEEQYDKTVFGFWIYLITDFVLFAAYFATYAVLQHRTFGGPPVASLMDMSAVVWRTVILLVGSFAAGIAGVQVHKRHRAGTLWWFGVTLICGLIFFICQYMECARIYEAGFGWQKSAAMSAYYNLVGVLMIHIIFAMIWTVLFAIPVFSKGITDTTFRRMSCLKMFWQFINVIWVFIFTIVYVMGVL